MPLADSSCSRAGLPVAGRVVLIAASRPARIQVQTRWRSKKACREVMLRALEDMDFDD